MTLADISELAQVIGGVATFMAFLWPSQNACLKWRAPQPDANPMGAFRIGQTA